MKNTEQKEKNIQSYLKMKKEFAEYEEKHKKNQLVDGFAFEFCNNEKVPEELIDRCPKCKHLFTLEQRREDDNFVSCPCGDSYADIQEHFIRIFHGIKGVSNNF